VALDVQAINPVLIGWSPSNLVVWPFVFARWEVTCVFCGTRFKRHVPELMIGSRMSWVACPECRTTTSCLITRMSAPRAADRPTRGEAR